MTETVKNPFPGMNPWLEEYWPDVHASILVYARDQLNAELPPGFQARVDERLAIDAGREKPTRYRPDVAITEDWDQVPCPALGEGAKLVAAAKPVIVDLGEEILRHLEIVDSRSHIITTIELLLPLNKQDGQPQLDWANKRSDHLRGGIQFCRD